LNVEFDALGVVTNFSGEPIKLKSTRVTPDAAIDAKVAAANVEIEIFKTQVVGTNNFFLNASRDLCRYEDVLFN
jgi:2',3'-cyclic-nucleotide 2'-phosphodiesterase (5'-nucleotidase family)